MDELRNLSESLLELRGVLVVLLFTGLGGIYIVWRMFRALPVFGGRVASGVTEDEAPKKTLATVGKFVLVLLALASFILVPPIIFGTTETGGQLTNIQEFWNTVFDIGRDILGGVAG